MKSVTEKAYAKINLFLSVGGKRPDGRHDVETVLYRVGIYDTVTVSAGKGDGITLECDDKSLPTDESNLAFKAAQLYLREAGIGEGVCIEIKKRIPVKAGMGGGSSDAAATLTALNGIFGELSFEKMYGIAASLGADVPFFLYGSDAMLGRGTGTVLTPAKALGTSAYGVFISCGEKLSTGAAYAALDVKRGENVSLSSADKLISALAENDLFAAAGAMENDFEISCEGFSEVAAKMYELGALKALLCGSGPTVCGIFADKSGADAARKMLGDGAFCATLGVK